MDDYLNVYDYIGDKEHEYSTATNISQEEHEMRKLAPEKVQQQPQISQSSTARNENEVQEDDLKSDLRGRIKFFIVMAVMILAVTLLISLAAIVLSIISQYNASNCRAGIKSQEENISEILVQFIEYIEILLMQLNGTLSQLNGVQNTTVTQLSLEQLRVHTYINQLSDNIISNLTIQLYSTNNEIKSVEENISQLFSQLSVTNMHCGAGVWRLVAYLNMNNPLQQCPSPWREYNSQFRACGRPVSSGESCSSLIYSTNYQYSKVCGRVIGIQVSSPDAFHLNRGINDGYMDGVSITNGSPRNHIWSYAGSFSEIANNRDVCPCNYSSAIQAPSFVGSNYYCESGNPTQDWVDRVFPNDKLWDGEQCSHEGMCCTGANTPPWFSVSLRSPTSDDIEVRVCGDEGTSNEDTPIELLEIYVQ